MENMAMNEIKIEDYSNQHTIDENTNGIKNNAKNKIKEHDAVIILSIISVLLLCSTVAMEYLYYNTKKSMETEIATLTSQIEDFSAQVEELQSQALDNKLQSEKKDNEISEKSQRISQLESSLNIANSINSRRNSNDFLSSGTGASSSNSYTCTFPNCNNYAGIGRAYCLSHACSASGCYNARLSTVCRYCKEHKCKESNCNFQAYQGGYCMLHSR